MSKHAVHFKSEKQDWETPQDFFDELNKEFSFDIDVCAHNHNNKLPFYFGPGSRLAEDGLKTEWLGWDFERKLETCWMNPPYGREIGKWIKKASEEAQKGCTVVALLPARTDTRYFHDYIYNKPNVEIRFIKGRLKFVGAEHAAPFPSMVVVFRPEKK